MSKFFKALEQAKRDLALRPESAPVNDRPAMVQSVESLRAHAAAATEPAADSVEDLDEHLVSLVAPAAFESEQYRALRHIVEQLHATADLKVIAISSPGIGDGKTVTSINLAGALAQAPDARVLLIDADLRRPALGRLLIPGGSAGSDLVDAILDPRITLEEIVRPRPPFHLSVICAGQTPPSPYEVLKSPRLGELIDEARARYDFIVIDTPPLAPVQDCRIIARWVDGFLLVVAAHRTPRRLLDEALATLDRAKILGIVFNQDERSAPGRYSSDHGAHYFAPGSTAASGGPRATLGRAVKQIGASLRRQHGSAGPRRRSARGPR